MNKQEKGGAMSEVTSVAKLEEMIKVLTEAKEHADKFDKGNKSAGTRLRVSMQTAKTMAQDIRTYVSEKKAQ